jgi:hypothetical protein
MLNFNPLPFSAHSAPARENLRAFRAFEQQSVRVTPIREDFTTDFPARHAATKGNEPRMNADRQICRSAMNLGGAAAPPCPVWRIDAWGVKAQDGRGWLVGVTGCWNAGFCAPRTLLLSMRVSSYYEEKDFAD